MSLPRIAFIYALRFGSFVKREGPKAWPFIKKKSTDFKKYSVKATEQFRSSPQWKSATEKLKQKTERYVMRYQETTRPKLLNLKRELQYQYEEIKFYYPPIMNKLKTGLRSKLFGEHTEFPPPTYSSKKWGKYYYLHPTYIAQFRINHRVIMYIKKLPIFQKFFYLLPLYWYIVHDDEHGEWTLEFDPDFYKFDDADQKGYDFTGWGNWSWEDFEDLIPDFVPQGFKRG